MQLLPYLNEFPMKGKKQQLLNFDFYAAIFQQLKITVGSVFLRIWKDLTII